MELDGSNLVSNDKTVRSEQDAYEIFNGERLLDYMFYKNSKKSLPEVTEEDEARELFRSVFWRSVMKPRRNTSLLWRPKYYFDSFFMKILILEMHINLIKVFYW